MHLVSVFCIPVSSIPTSLSFLSTVQYDREIGLLPSPAWAEGIVLCLCVCVCVCVCYHKIGV